MTFRITHFALAALLFSACRRESGDPPPVSWNFEIRPLLAAKCLPCHGPLDAANASGLRLDRVAFGAVPPGSPGPGTIVPGDRDRSLLWQWIQSGHPAELEPPPEAWSPLEAAERERIGRWIDQGAPSEAHWAFQPLRTVVPVPEATTAWPHNAIDHFVLARMARAGLRPAGPADPRKWLRRVTLDLTGIPPTAGEIADFLAASRPGAGNPQGPPGGETAREAVVDRLLASPDFAERMATAWLEAIPYADTWNFTDEPLHGQWAYRDWVVRAVHENLPYDRFVEQQLAGDLGEDPSREEILATAFLRNHPLPAGDGVSRAERLADLAAQRVQLVGGSLLGIRLECARCHRHPADPVTPREFEGLAALLAVAAESGVAGAVVPAPVLPLPSAAQEHRLLEERGRVAALEEQLASLPGRRDAMFRTWLGQENRLPVIADAVGIFPFDDPGPTIRNRALGASASGTAAGVDLVKGVHGKAVRLAGPGTVDFPDLPAITRWNAWTFAMWIRDPADAPREATVLSRSGSGRGIDLRLDGGHLSARLVREWPGNAVAVRSAQAVIRPGGWTHVAWTSDGSGSAAGLRLYANGRESETVVLADRLWQSVVPAAATPLRLGGEGFEVDDLHVYDRALTPLEVAHLHDGRALGAAVRRGDEQVDLLAQFYFSSLDPEARRVHRELTAARRRLVETEDRIPGVAVMGPAPQTAERPAPDPAPRASGILPPLAAASRLDLAAALTAPDHPLPARVFVNRVWALFFGEGLVATPGDFGIMSPAPSHPDLLDWLARDFVAAGWDVKRLCRTIALSATYGQDTAADPVATGHSVPALAGVPPRALSPAEFRDLALAASGLLDNTVGGPPVPRGETSHRRTLYSAWIRGTPRLLPVTTDDADRPRCPVEHAPEVAPERVASLDRLLVESSRALAQRILQDAPGGDAARLEMAFIALAGRPPGPAELGRFTGALAAHRARFRDPGDEAPRLVPGGAFRTSPDVDPQDLAAWTALCEELLGTEAVRWRR